MKNRRQSRVLVLERSRYGYGRASQSKIAFIEKHIGKIAELSRLYVSNLLLLATIQLKLTMVFGNLTSSFFPVVFPT
jgi:hypothetical protein